MGSIAVAVGEFLKICFCIKGMNNPGGGAERVLAEVASSLAARGHDVSLLSFDRPNGELFFPLDPRIRRIELGIGSTVERTNLSTTVKRIAAMRRTLKQETPDVAIGFMHSTYIPLGIALLGTGIPLIASEHIVLVDALSHAADGGGAFEAGAISSQAHHLRFRSGGEVISEIDHAGHGGYPKSDCGIGGAGQRCRKCERQKEASIRRQAISAEGLRCSDRCLCQDCGGGGQLGFADCR